MNKLLTTAAALLALATPSLAGSTIVKLPAQYAGTWCPLQKENFYRRCNPRYLDELHFSFHGNGYESSTGDMACRSTGIQTAPQGGHFVRYRCKVIDSPNTVMDLRLQRVGNHLAVFYIEEGERE